MREDFGGIINKEPTYPSPTKYNCSERLKEEVIVDSIGRRKQIEYVIDPDSGEKRQKTYLEQTGKRKPVRHSRKLQQQIEWRRNKLFEYLIMGKSLADVSRIMNIPYKTLYADYQFLADQARENMKNSFFSDLPFNIRQAVDGLNKLISILYDIQDINAMKLEERKTSDHVRVMAINLIKECIKQKIEIFSSQGTINHALDFIEGTKQQIRTQFNQYLWTPTTSSF